jgi:RNA polymerase sigma factor (sigma-70 family)
MLQAEIRNALWNALARLKPKLREILVLVDIQETPLEEIALAEGCSVATLRKRLSRARLEMRRRLAPAEPQADDDGAYEPGRTS